MQQRSAQKPGRRFQCDLLNGTLAFRIHELSVDEQAGMQRYFPVEGTRLDLTSVRSRHIDNRCATWCRRARLRPCSHGAQPALYRHHHGAGGQNGLKTLGRLRQMKRMTKATSCILGSTVRRRRAALTEKGVPECFIAGYPAACTFATC